jgi:delta 1-pyrroline-5-carboxylate dehydrogenase
MKIKQQATFILPAVIILKEMKHLKKEVLLN